MLVVKLGGIQSFAATTGSRDVIVNSMHCASLAALQTADARTQTPPASTPSHDGPGLEIMLATPKPSVNAAPGKI